MSLEAWKITVFLGLLLLCLALHCLFVIAKVAIKRSRASRLRERRATGCPTALYARLVLLRAENNLVGVQIGTFLSTLLVGFCVLSVMNHILILQTGNLNWVGDSWWYFLAAVALFVAMASVALVFIQVSKSIAFANPERALCLTAIPILIFNRVSRPAVLVLNGVVEYLLDLFDLTPPVGRVQAASAQQLTELVEMSREAGEIEEEEQEMIERVFTFSDTLVHEVMTPRADVVSISEDASLEQIVKIFGTQRLSRVLLTGTGLDDVKGVLHAKDLIGFVGRDSSEFNLKELIRRPHFVPYNMSVGDLLPELRQQGVHLAVVLDEHGGVDGVVTVEDLVEEIVGEIFDEYDTPYNENSAIRTRSGDLLVDAGALIDDLNKHHELNLPIGEYDTIAGLVVQRLGRIPHIGDQIEVNGRYLTVERLVQNRVRQIRISQNKPRVLTMRSTRAAVRTKKIVQNNQELSPSTRSRISDSA